jgi:alpha-glucosidase
MLVDEGWSWKSSTDATILPGADITRTAPGVDMPALVAYAAQRKVGLFVWVNWKLMDRDMDRALDQYQRWGLKGIKVDFINREDQQAVEFYHRLLAKAAAHHLLVDLHGAYAPRGLERTYPNFITQEGVMGAEYNKWSTRVTATHNVTLPFTRMLLGPADYTPGGFRNATPASFVARNDLPEVQTTRGQQLAMYVVYSSPLGVLADAPKAYEGPNASGAEFLKQVPTTWDETRGLSGEIGQWVAVARRKGGDWYVGAMTNEQGRALDVPLTFLPKGRWRAEIWRDGDRPDAVVSEIVAVEAKGEATPPLALKLAPSGGAAIRFVRER